MKKNKNGTWLPWRPGKTQKAAKTVFVPAKISQER